jgi:hypothetical protein
MADFVAMHWYLAVGLLIVVGGGFVVFLRVRGNRDRSGYTLLDYLLVWPVILGNEMKSQNRTSTRFVVVGVAIGLFLIFVGIRFNRRG